MPITVMNQGANATATNQAQTNALLTELVSAVLDLKETVKPLGEKFDNLSQQVEVVQGILAK